MNWYKKAQVDNYDPVKINKNMDEFHSRSQNTNPDAENFAVDLRLDRKSIPSSIKKKINNGIHDLGNYHQEIPLGRIFDICKQNGVIALQEDGTKWSGFLVGGAECGSEKANGQYADFDLAIKNEEGKYIPSNNVIRLTWCVMGSGKYEIVCYVS